jgi:nucleoside-triphosphatase
MSAKKKTLLTGPPSRGKTTVVRHLLEVLPPGAAAGFYTEEIREGARRAGFAAQVVGGPGIVLARVPGTGHWPPPRGSVRRGG